MAVTAGGTWATYRNARHGPFEHNGKLFAITQDTSFRRSLNGGQTWGSGPSFVGFGREAVQVGNLLHCLIMSGTGDWRVRVFNMDTETWGTETTTTQAFNHNNVTGARPVFLAVRSNGNYVVFHQGPIERIMGTDYRRVAYSIWNGSSWTTTVPAFQNGGQWNVDGRAAFGDENDNLHFFMIPSGTGVQSLTLSANNQLNNGSGSLNAAITSESDNYPVGVIGYGDQVAWALTSRASATYRLMRGVISNSISWDRASSSVTIVPHNLRHDLGTPGVVLSIEGVVHVFYVRLDNGNIEYTNDQGTNTWTTPEVFATANTQGISAGYLPGLNAIGVLFNDGGTVKFDTYALAPPEPITETPTLSLGSVIWDSVALSWTDAEHATQYEIYRNGSLLTTVGGTSYTDETVSPNTSYDYYVRGINSEYTGPNSNTVSATTPWETLAQAPTLSLDSIETSVDLSWTSLANTTEYDVRRTLLPKPDWVNQGLVDGLQFGINEIKYADGIWLAIASNGQIFGSSDGASWSERSTPVGTPLLGGFHDGAQWFAVGNSGVILTSSNSFSWTQQQSVPTSSALWNVAFDGTLFVIVGASGTILTSTDGVNWDQETSPVSQSLYSVVFHKGIWIAVGQSGTIIRSFDGKTWEQVTSPVSVFLRSIAATGGAWVAVGDAGTVLTSVNGGATWTEESTPTQGNLRSVATNGSQWFAVGGTGDVITSLDLVTWVTQDTSVPESLNAIAYSDNKWVTAGSSSTPSFTLEDTAEVIDSAASTSFTDNTVLENTSYEYQVRGTNPDSNGPYSNTVTANVPGPPVTDAPTLSLGTVTSNSVPLSWTSVANAIEYEVRRNGVLVQTIASTSWTDETVTGGNSYDYDVRGVNSDSDGPYSNVVTAITPLPVSVDVSHGLTLGHGAEAARGATSGELAHGLTIGHGTEAGTKQVSVELSHGLVPGHSADAARGATEASAQHGLVVGHDVLVRREVSYEEVMQEMTQAWEDAWAAKTQQALDDFYENWTGYAPLGLFPEHMRVINTPSSILEITPAWLAANEDGVHIHFTDGRWWVERVEFDGPIRNRTNDITYRGFRVNRRKGVATDEAFAFRSSGQTGVVIEFGEITQEADTEAEWALGGRGFHFSAPSDDDSNTLTTVARNLDIHGTSRSGIQYRAGSTMEYCWVHDMLYASGSGSIVSCSIVRDYGWVRRNYFQDGNHSAYGIYAHDDNCSNTVIEENLCNMQRTETQAAWGLLGGGSPILPGSTGGTIFRYNRFGTKYHPKCGTQGSNRQSEFFHNKSLGNEWFGNTWLTDDEYNGYVVEPNPGGDGSVGPLPSQSPAPGESEWGPLPAPGSFAGVALSHEEIELSWNLVPGAVKYEIERDGVVIAEVNA